MIQTIISKTKTILEIQACYPIMRQLRLHFEAHKLYLNHGFKIIGHHFALTLKA